ncbi:MAG: DedA family protein [Acidobacteriia bacterium]|nr:DedA family protein [Terriglobia bacterium]
MENTVLQWVASYGYIAIFSLLVLGIVGLPVPDEFLLTGCGFLIYQHHLRPVPAFFSALAGSMSGITCSYIIGRTIGWRFLHSRFGRLLHISDARIRSVHDWFDRIGHWALLAGYFIPGVRHFTAIVAGTSKLELPSFAMYAYSGATIWVSTFLFIGYHFGERWPQILALVERHLKLASFVAGIAILAYLLVRYIIRKRRSRPSE